MKQTSNNQHFECNISECYSNGLTEKRERAMSGYYDTAEVTAIGIGRFADEVEAFNHRCGNKSVDADSTLEEVFAAAKQQGSIILEEVYEILAAVESQDETALKDGIIDTLYTAIRLLSLFGDRYNLAHGMFKVAENNNLKYTTDPNVAEEWMKNYLLMNPENPDGVYLNKKTTIHGKSFYCLKDKNGKVRKWIGFPSVDLSGV